MQYNKNANWKIFTCAIRSHSFEKTDIQWTKKKKISAHLRYHYIKKVKAAHCRTAMGDGPGVLNT